MGHGSLLTSDFGSDLWGRADVSAECIDGSALSRKAVVGRARAVEVKVVCKTVVTSIDMRCMCGNQVALRSDIFACARITCLHFLAAAPEYFKIQWGIS